MYDDYNADPMIEEYSMSEPGETYDMTDSFTDRIPQEMLEYASDRYTDDGDEDLVMAAEDEY